jgi:MFS family permease
MVLLLTLVRAHSAIWTWIPGLFLFGAGVGVMLTSSVNVVQSSFPDKDQGDISGLSRSVSNLGSSFGTALVGSVLVAAKLPAGKPFAVALTMMLVFTLIGLVLGVLIPRRPVEATATAHSGGARRAGRYDGDGAAGLSTPRATRAHRHLLRRLRRRAPRRVGRRPGG